jgi:hypothetical protein
MRTTLPGFDKIAGAKVVYFVLFDAVDVAILRAGGLTRVLI